MPKHKKQRAASSKSKAKAGKKRVAKQKAYVKKKFEKADAKLKSSGRAGRRNKRLKKK